ncbi:MAG: hypothetical protein EOP60_03285 [Sphingomonadales bacterium]|nr:MAG: hypothetical protein EOP60_03285 [Sphingomonadales bacterium]
MEYKITISSKEIDVRSSQFSCELTIANTGGERFEIVDMTPRLPKGVTLNDAIDSSKMELSKRYDMLCEKYENMIGNYLVSASEKHAQEQFELMNRVLKQMLSLKGVFDFYKNMILAKMPKVMANQRAQLIRVPVENAREAERALAIAEEAGVPVPELGTLRYTLEILRDIEQQEEFVLARRARAEVQPGQEHKSVYIVDAKRGLFDAASYSVNFDISLRSNDGSQISRTETAPLLVTPNAATLTAVAVASALIGRAIKLLAVNPNSISFDVGTVLNSASGYLLAGLTALIVFNIFDFTALRDQFQAKISWRAAILIGFVCGYLTDRLLRTLETLLGT